ncbi:peptidylprolyl isomerase [Flavobacteriaceae bacterium M23B6Z8]
MFTLSRSLATIILLIFLMGCNSSSTKKKSIKESPGEVVKSPEEEKDSVIEPEEPEPFRLDEENAIQFFFEYGKENPEDKVRITTDYGSFVIKLYDKTPYHRANFIYLTKNGYYNNTYFHRVVKNFIIQGGNADTKETARKRAEIGRYLLPPDTRKGYSHHRGTVSMPSSDINNPHKLASPYEFFIVVTRPGSYHLDGDYTAFGRVIEGMDVVDKINAQPTDDGEWPVQNIKMQVEVVD